MLSQTLYNHFQKQLTPRLKRNIYCTTTSLNTGLWVSIYQKAFLNLTFSTHNQHIIITAFLNPSLWNRNGMMCIEINNYPCCDYYPKENNGRIIISLSDPHSLDKILYISNHIITKVKSIIKINQYTERWATGEIIGIKKAMIIKEEYSQSKPESFSLINNATIAYNNYKKKLLKGKKNGI